MTLHLVRLGRLGRLGGGRDRWAACGYRRDFIARHWWIDCWRWRLCLIRREVS